MSTILSPQQFSQALQNMRGMPQEAVAECLRHYDGAARGARSALPRLPSLGLFSSERDRIAGFLSVCKHLDTLVEQNEISKEEAQVSLYLMTVSDKSCWRAVKAFMNWAAPRFRDDLTTNSETADTYLSNYARPN